MLLVFLLPIAFQAWAQEDAYGWSDFLESITTDEENTDSEEWVQYVEELQTLHEKLAAGRKVVRACQTALHELKYARRMYNAAYDSMQRVLMEAVTPETEYVN